MPGASTTGPGATEHLDGREGCEGDNGDGRPRPAWSPSRRASCALDTTRWTCNTATMTPAPAPDYRTQRSPTPEGSGNAKAKWDEFHFVKAIDLVEEACASSGMTVDDAPEEVRDQIVEAVIDESELMGFWLAWWRAGGFAGLEAAGWNRATIFRRLRRFRTTFGVHPDDYKPNWIRLNLGRLWTDELRRRLEPEPDLPGE